MVKIEISTGPVFLRPELLTHPPIPLALRGVNPRTIKGQDWWDAVRHKAYNENNHCCWACGASEQLDAHEAYTYDIKNHIAKLDEIVGLCGKCHQYIHSSLTSRTFRLGVISYDRMYAVMEHGSRILEFAGLKPHYISRAVWWEFAHRSGHTIAWVCKNKFGVPYKRLANFWTSKLWRLELDGKMYHYFSDVVVEARRERRGSRHG